MASLTSDQAQQTLYAMLLGEPPYDRYGAPEPGLLLELVPVLPDQVLAEAVWGVAGMGVIWPTQRLRLLAALLERVSASDPAQDDLLAQAVVQIPEVIPCLAEPVLPRTLSAVRAFEWWDEPARATALALLSARSPEPSLQDVLDAARAPIDYGDRSRAPALAEAISRLRGPLPEGALSDLLAAARAMVAGNDRGTVLAGLLSCCEESARGPVVFEALAAFQADDERTPERVGALAAFSRQLPEPLRNQVLDQAVGEARALDAEDARARALIEVSRRVDEPLASQLLREVHSLDLSPPDRISLAPYLSEAQLERALETLPFEPAMLEGALAELAPHLPERLLAKALRQGEDDASRLAVLQALAPHLPLPLLDEALGVALSLEGRWERERALAALWPFLSEDLRQCAQVAEADRLPGERIRELWALLPREQQVTLAEDAIHATAGYYGGAEAERPVPALISPVDGLPTSTQVEFRWQDVGAPAYKLRVDGVVYWTTATSLVLELDCGVHRWTVCSQGALGNASAYASEWTVDVDTTLPPTPALISPLDDAHANQHSVEFCWQNVNAFAYNLRVDGVVYTTTATSMVRELDVGMHTWTVQALDALGNASVYASARRVVFTASAPEPPGTEEVWRGIEDPESPGVEEVWRGIEEPGAEGGLEPKGLPAEERLVNTGFSTPSRAGLPVDPLQPLAPGRQFYFWFQVGRRVFGAIDTADVALPVEHLPVEARLTVALYAFEGELLLTPGRDVGEIQVQSDLSVRVVRPVDPAGAPDTVWPEDPLLEQRCLFFPIATPHKHGFHRLRCNIYYEGILVQSHLVQALVTEPGFRSAADAPALTTRCDYTLSNTLRPEVLTRLEPHRLSLMINDNGDGTHGFRFFGRDEVEAGDLRDVKYDSTFDGHALQHLIDLTRGAMRRVSWGDEEPWDWRKMYRYGLPVREGRLDRDLIEQLQGDLIRLARRGYSFYVDIIGELAAGDETSRRAIREQRKKLEALMARPGGLIQIACKESVRHVVPLSIVYDYGLDPAAPDDAFSVCPEFLAALRARTPLGETACFQGQCPSRGELDVVCPSGFWGYRHGIGMPVSIGGSLEDAVTEIVYHGAPQMTVAVSTDKRLRLRAEHERALRALRDDVGWHYADTRDEALDLMGAEPSHVVYFYCHGGVSEDDLPYIEVGPPEQGRITSGLMFARDLFWEGPQPLVFINGCHTTALEPEVAFDLVRTFVETVGAAGVIGTEITIYEPLAVAFGEACLKRFMDGTPIGEAVRLARFDLLQQGNPLGLVYDAFAVASLKMVPAS